MEDESEDEEVGVEGLSLTVLIMLRGKSNLAKNEQ